MELTLESSHFCSGVSPAALRWKAVAVCRGGKHDKIEEGSGPSHPLTLSPRSASAHSTLGALDGQERPPNPSVAQTSLASGMGGKGAIEPIKLGQEGVSCPRGSARGLAASRRCSPACSPRAPRPSPESYAAAERRPRAVRAIAASAAASGAFLR